LRPTDPSISNESGILVDSLASCDAELVAVRLDLTGITICAGCFPCRL